MRKKSKMERVSALSRKESSIHSKIFIGLLVTLVVIYAVNIFITDSVTSPLTARIAASKPAEIFATVVTNNCTGCFNMTSVVNFLKQRANIVGEREFLFSSTEGKALIDKYNVTTLPALIVSGEVGKSSLSAVWQSLGGRLDKGAIVVANIPPYFDLSTSKTIGLVEVIYLTDNSCSECYDVGINQQILARFGLGINRSLSYDISSQDGKNLISKYKIENAPIILLSPDTSVYSALVQVWPSVGSVESDGWFVMRDPSVLGTYKNLVTGEIVKPSQQTSVTNQTNQISAGAVKEFTIDGKEFSFAPPNITVNKGDTVRITFRNVGNIGHNFGISALGIRSRTISAGASDTVEFVATESGTFEFDCSVPGHRESGMVGKLVVS